MDLVTQGIIGASFAQLSVPADKVRRAACIGCLAGLLPDADFLVQSVDDPLLALEFHRHFTHSLISVPLMAALLAILLWPSQRRQFDLRTLFRVCLFGLLPSGLLDVCTSYGTHLFWPFYDKPISLDIIAIVDPIFTSFLFLPLLIGLYHRRREKLGIVLAATYLVFAWVQHERAVSFMERWREERGHEITDYVVKPTMGNLLLWRSLYSYKDEIFVDALRLGDPIVRYPGGVVSKFVLERDLAWADRGTRVWRDSYRFLANTRGWAIPLDNARTVLGDIRYSMLPNGIDPLWELHFQRENPNAVPRLISRRSLSPEVREVFSRMLFGLPIPR